MPLCGKPAFKYFALIMAISDWKFEEIFLALCKSPLIKFFLYRNGTLEDQWTGHKFFDKNLDFNPIILFNNLSIQKPFKVLF